MKIPILKKKVLLKDKIEFYSTHLKIINCFYPEEISKTEIKILANFMSLDKTVVHDDRFNTLARKMVKEALEISSASLSNHLSALVKKKIISKNEITGRLKIHPNLFPGDKIQQYQLAIGYDNSKRDS